MAYLKKGRYDLAIADYSTAIEFKPELLDAYEDYTKAIKPVPEFAPLYFKRGDAYNGKGEYDLAIEEFS